MPRSSALWTTFFVASKSMRPPKLLQPRPTTDTSRPDRPRLRCSNYSPFYLRDLPRQPDGRDLAGDDQVASGRRPDFLDLYAGGDFTQRHALRGYLEQPEIGGDQIDDAARGGRDGASLDEAGLAVAGLVLHCDKDMFGAGGQIHCAADAAPLLACHLPIREVAVLGDFVGAE